VSRFRTARSGLSGWCLLLPSLAGCPASAASAASDEVVIRGEAVCLDAADAPMAKGAACPDQPAGGWALRTADGTLHGLSSDDSRVAMLSDERVRSRELQITAWRDDRTRGAAWSVDRGGAADLPPYPALLGADRTPAASPAAMESPRRMP
jgi:hypothetical protein